MTAPVYAVSFVPRDYPRIQSPQVFWRSAFAASGYGQNVVDLPDSWATSYIVSEHVDSWAPITTMAGMWDCRWCERVTADENLGLAVYFAPYADYGSLEFKCADCWGLDECPDCGDWKLTGEPRCQTCEEKDSE